MESTTREKIIRDRGVSLTETLPVPDRRAQLIMQQYASGGEREQNSESVQPMISKAVGR